MFFKVLSFGISDVKGDNTLKNIDLDKVVKEVENIISKKSLYEK